MKWVALLCAKVFSMVESCGGRYICSLTFMRGKVDAT